jgi:hypothetical protein
VATQKRVKKSVKKVAKRRRTTKEIPLTKLDFWAIACNEVYMACRRAGMDEGTALAFAMDRESYPDWIVDPKQPEVKPFEEDEDED